jgi:hypothetical protein
MTNALPPAGGRATEAGMSFGAGVGAWFAAATIAESPIGHRFGLDGAVVPTVVQFESGRYLDDIEVQLSDGGLISIQCKTKPSPSDQGIANTIGQLAGLALACKNGSAPSDANNVAAVLAVSVDAPASLNNLEAACRFFDQGAQWAEAAGRLNQLQRNALDGFAARASAAWIATAGEAPQDSDLALMARLFRIVRFDVQQGGRDDIEAADLLAKSLFKDNQEGASALAQLHRVVRTLVRSGAPARRSGLLEALRRNGVEDTRNPRFESDIEQLRARSVDEVDRLRRHARLPIGDGLPIPRECMPSLQKAVDGGSLLVIGEPGAGKTGVLVALAEQRLTAGSPFVFVSVDRLAGVQKQDDLRTELGLQHPLLDVLEAWPGTAPGVLIVDALDASRGGQSEAVFAALIEDGLRRLGERWSIVASIRTFDLRSGTRFKSIVSGEPPAPLYSDPLLSSVRHFLIPRLSPVEIDAITSAAPELQGMLTPKLPAFRELLRNVFNLSLAVELIVAGVDALDLQRVTTQSRLIERYEDLRLPTGRLQNAVADALKVMVAERRIIIPKFAVGNDAIDEVLHTGVMAAAADRIAFAHHVLFDHAASRYYLRSDDTIRLLEQVSGDPSLGFLLGPALRFAMEKVWSDDGPGRTNSWRLIAQLTSADAVDPVVASIAMRTAVESVATVADAGGLIALIGGSTTPNDTAKMLSKLVRFVGMSMDEREVTTGIAFAWTAIAKAAVDAKGIQFADGARFLLWRLSLKAPLDNPELADEFGLAARAFLALIWSTPKLDNLAAAAIGFVCSSFGSDPVASRGLLEQILTEPRFTEHAHDEAPWLAEGVPVIARHDPDFAVIIYSTLFGRSAPREGKTQLGSSRIVPLTTTMEQDYQQARWQLSQHIDDFLAVAPGAATRAINAAVLGVATEGRSWRGGAATEKLVAGYAVRIVETDPYPQDWRVARNHVGHGDDLLASFATYLAACSPDQFTACALAARSEESASAIWARLLGIGATRVNVADDILWPLASDPEIMGVRGLSRDAVIYMAAAYPSASANRRRRFEEDLYARANAPETAGGDWLRSLAARFFSVVDQALLVTDQMAELRADLTAKGEIAGNPPMISLSVSSGPAGDLTDHLLTRRGVDLQNGPDHELRALTKQLEDLLGQGDDRSLLDLIELWSATKRTVDEIDRLATQAHEEVLHSTWGAISNAVEKIVEADALVPGLAEPDFAGVMSVIQRLAASPYPAPPQPGEGSDLMSWGNWDVRVYAASSVMHLAHDFGAQEPEVIALIEKMLTDPSPNVRLQVAQSLNVLRSVDPVRMWELIERVATQEDHPGVLGFFVAGPVHQLNWEDPQRIERLVSSILTRLPDEATSEESAKRNTLEDAIGALASQLWVGQGRPGAREWFRRWCAELKDGKPFLWPAVSVLRSALFARFAEPDSEQAAGIQLRAREVVLEVVAAAAAGLQEAENLAAQGDEASNKRAQDLYVASDAILHHVSNQFYFGSGAYQNSSRGDAPGLTTAQQKRSFLEEYRETLSLIGTVGTPGTLHHLIELYAFLVEAAPETVFDSVSELIVGPASKEGYQFESLGADVLVKLIRHYLADYRSIFSGAERRSRLVAVLELFSNAGWPEALKLLFELPDLLR